MRSVITQEMAMRAKQSQNSLPFLVLISDLYRWVGIPFVAKTDVEVSPTSYIDIRWIKILRMRLIKGIVHHWTPLQLLMLRP